MSIPSIPREEFAERRNRAQMLTRAQGLHGLLVCSRGGGTLDRYADVMYLTNFYTPFPYIPDLPGNWTARAHSFLILPADADPELIIDVPDDGRIALPTSQTTYTDLVLEETIGALRRAKLTKGRVGLVGADVMTVEMYRRLQTELPEVEWVDAQGILADLRSIKSEGEIAVLRRASQVGSRTIEAMMAAAVPGANHGEIVAAGMQVLLPEGGILYNSFMASGRGGEAPTLAKSNFPTWSSPARLEEGDWLRLGISGVVAGYYFDVSRSKAIGPATNRQVSLFEAAIACVEAGIAALRPGITAGELAQAGLGKQRALGFEVKGVFSGLGHGIGLGWDVPWLTIGEPTVIRPNMVLNFERTVTQDGFLGDFEETVLVTDDGPVKLTDAQTRFW